MISLRDLSLTYASQLPRHQAASPEIAPLLGFCGIWLPASEAPFNTARRWSAAAPISRRQGDPSGSRDGARVNVPESKRRDRGRYGRVPGPSSFHLNPAILGFIGPIQLHGHNALEARVALTGPAADRTSQYQVFGLPCQAPLFGPLSSHLQKLGFRVPRERSHA